MLAGLTKRRAALTAALGFALLEPELLAEISYSEMMEERLRGAVYRGLRAGMPARECSAIRVARGSDEWTKM